MLLLLLLLLLLLMACAPSRHRLRLTSATDLTAELFRVWTEEVLQWYRKFPVVLVECQGSRASVPASVVPGRILGSWGQLCCPSNVCMPEDGFGDRISAELVVWIESFLGAISRRSRCSLWSA